MTKQLPLKPNLEYDKKQAKKLLRAFYDRDEDAIKRIHQHLPHVQYQPIDSVSNFPLTLMQAQTVIAREYGFKSWGDLRLAIKLKNKDYGDKLELFKQAVYQHDATVLDKLLAEHPDLCNTLNDPHFAFGSTAIILSKHHLDVVDVLLKHGADINTKSQWWAGDFHVLEGAATDIADDLLKRGATMSPHAAAEQGWMDWLEQAYQDDPDIVNLRGGDGKTPLHYATAPHVIDWLLERGADINIRDIDHQSTPLQWMIGMRKWDAARLFVERGAQVDIFATVALGDLSLVQQALVEYPDAIRARINETGYPPVPQADGGHQYGYVFSSGMSPHQVALQRGFDAIYDFLVEKSAPEIRLMAYCARGDRDKAQELIHQYPDLIDTIPHVDQLQLVHTAWNREIDALKLMLDLGFDVHLKDSENMTALHRASFHGFDDIVELLLEVDASPPLDRLNVYGGSPLTTCLYGSKHSWRDDGDFERTLKLLVDAGSPIKAEWIPTGNDFFDSLLRQRLNLES